MSNQAETPGSESESNLMDYGLFDLHTNLSHNQRNYNRGEAKVNFAISIDLLSIYSVLLLVSLLIIFNILEKNSGAK